MRLFSVGLVLFVFSSSYSYAQYGYNSAANTINYTTMPHNFTVEGQIYDGSVSGLRDYFEEQLKLKNSDVYHQLNSELENLEAKKLASYLLGVGGGLVGFGLMFNALRCEVEDDTCFNANLYGGSGIALVSLLGALILHPSRKQMMKFINKHNRINEKNKIDWRLGVIPTKNNLVSQLQVRF